MIQQGKIHNYCCIARHLPTTVQYSDEHQDVIDAVTVN